MGIFKQKFNPVSGSFNLVPTSTIVTFKDGVANAAALPISGNTLNDGRITADTGHLYVWDGSTWVDQGDIVDLKWSAIEDKPTSSVANIDDAVSKRHTQNSDTKLAEGTANEVTVANVKDAVDKKHTQGTDQGLDTGGLNATTAAQVKSAVDNSHAPHSDDQDLSGKVDKVTGSSLVPDTEIAKIHIQNTDTILDEGGENEISAQQLRELSLIGNSADGVIAEIQGKLQLPYTVLHTDTDPTSLNTVIQSLVDGDILEVDSSAVYNPISIPANKELIIRPTLGKCINLTGTECVKLMNGARDSIIAGISIQNCTSPSVNDRGAGVSFGEIHAKVSNISFYNISIDTVISGSGVMLSYHWSVGGDFYYTPNTISECSTDVRFINCCFYKANKSNTEGAALSLRGIIGAFIYNCHFRDDALSMRQLQLQNCVSAYVAKNNIRNTATSGTNSEGIKLDDLGSCTFRTTGYIIENVIKNAIEGIDLDDNVTALVQDNICYECTEEGISVDDSAIVVLARNLCYNCRYDSNSAGIRVESGAVVSMYQNNCVNNIINYRIQNGYVLPSGNGLSITDVILKDSAENLMYEGNIATVFNIQDAIDYLDTNKEDSLGFTPEDVSNKDTSTSLGTSDTKYPSQKAVKSYVDALGITVDTIKDISLNIMLNAFRIAQIGSLTIFSMVKGFVDEYEDESGIDTVNSLNEIYNTTDDFYEPFSGVDSYTKLLLHLDNDVVDAENTPKTLTNSGITFSTSIKKFGTHAGSFDGGDYASIPASTDFDFESGDYTLDLWVYADGTTSGKGGVVGCVANGNSTGWGLKLMGTDYGADSGKLAFFTNGNWQIKTASVFPQTTWTHVALVRSSGVVTLYIDGVAEATTYNGTVTGSSGTIFVIGDLTTNLGSPFIGGLDEIRISKGIARWTSDFTPETAAYEGITEDMTLISNVQVASIVPTDARIILFEEDDDSITLNTDLKAYVSRDNGTTFSQVTLEDEGNYITGARILSGIVDISAQPSGSNMKYKIETLNAKKLKIHGTAVSYK